MFGLFKSVAQRREEFELEKERIQFNDERNERLKLEQFRLEEDASHCDTCDILQRELAMLRSERDMLLSKIINPPTNEAINKPTGEMKPIQTSKHLSFTSRRQILERNDRELARAQREAEKATGVSATGQVIGKSLTSVSELEKDLGIEEKSNA